MATPPRSTNPVSGSPARATPPGGPGSLPVFLTSLLGREDEIALARSLLGRPELRLLTVTGPGGIGKTRLAIAAAARSAVDFPGGVTFVPLASVRDPSMVMPAVATALGLQQVDRAGIDDSVAAALGEARALLVVDNVEHVMDAAPALTRLLARCPNLTILATSRSLLRVEGEHALPVPPLAMPRAREALTPDDWLQVPVVMLFIERARAVDASLEPGAADIGRLVEICERLDGLPLAVELAATRVRHLTLVEINDRLDALMPLLVHGSRDHPSRLQTMRNAIAWSYDLLTSQAQALLRHASVFSGGFTAEAIAVVSGEGVAHARPATPVDEGIAALIDASLLIRESVPSAGTTRYRMLETIREFAWERLEARGEAHRAQDAHAAWYAGFAEQHEISELIPENERSMDLLAGEQDNLRAALTWLAASSHRERFERLVASLGRFWLAQSNYREGRAWAERALADRAAPPSADSARILVALGMTALFQEDTQVAEAHLTRGVDACRRHGEAHSAALALIGLAGLAVARGDSKRSARVLAEAREAAATIPDARLGGIVAGWVAINLAVAERAAGNGAAAERHVGEALERFTGERFPVGRMMALGDLGDLARDRGDWSRAMALYREALGGGRPDHARRIVLEIIESVAIVAAQRGQAERGATLLGAVEGLRDRIGLRYRQPRSRMPLDAATAAIRVRLPADELAAAWGAGRSLTEEQAIAEALAVPESADGSPSVPLTARETEILGLLVTGMTDPEIADALYISSRTVEHHVASVCRKLGVRTRTAATSTAIAAGLVPAGGST